MICTARDPSYKFISLQVHTHYVHPKNRVSANELVFRHDSEDRQNFETYLIRISS